MFDLLIKNATLIDGSGMADTPTADVAITDRRIAAVDPGIEAQARRVIDAGGLALAPGFIDIHAHSDIGLLEQPRADIKVRQGVTLEVLGNCGSSLAPLGHGSKEMVLQNIFTDVDTGHQAVNWESFGEFADAVEQSGISVHAMALVGHGTLRISAMGLNNNPPDTRQMEYMKRLLAQAVEEGACGLSTGLIYAPGCFARTAELIRLCRVLKEKGGFYASHMRNEAGGILEAVEEVIEIGRAADVPVHISHLKVAGTRNWHLVDKVIERIESARTGGLDITCDVYPYFCSSTTMLALLPSWSLDGGVAALLPRLENQRQLEQIIGDIENGLPGWENMFHNSGWAKITVAAVSNDANKHLEGKTVARSAEEADRDPFEWVLDLIKAETGRITIVSESMAEKNVARFLALPFAMAGSDGLPGKGRPHPRLYGTFPRIIRRFVSELGTLSLPEAVHKMTGMPARRLGLAGSGTIKKGARADVVLFDPRTIRDTATYDDPRRHPEGIPWVIVNGEVVIDRGNHTGAAPGRVLKSAPGPIEEITREQ